MPRARPTPTPTVRLRADLMLTEQESRKLEEHAAAELRSVADTVRQLLAEDLQRKQPTRGPTKAKRGDKRSGYSVNLSLTVPERRALEERARKEERSVSNYVTVVVLRAMRRRS